MIKFKKQLRPINGDIKVQGDVDISYFSIIMASLAMGKSKIYGLNENKNTLNLIEIFRQFGVKIEKEDDGNWVVYGNGLKSLTEPINIVDIKLSKEILYLLVGLFSSYNFKIFFKGDDTLSNTDLIEVFSIFKSLNVNFAGRSDRYLPFLMMGNTEKKPINYEVNDYNSVIKNAMLLASLNGNPEKENIVKEKEKSKNHLEILMKYFGILLEEHEIGSKLSLNIKIGREINIKGNQDFSGKEIIIPADVSFSSFIAALAILIPDSNIVLKNVLMNQHRDAFYRTLIDMGADILFTNQKIVCGEKISDISIKYRKLRDTIIPANRIYKMMYEYPILIFIACMTDVNIEIQGIRNIKFQELYNYNSILETVRELGITFDEADDSLKIKNKNIDKTREIIISDKIEDARIRLTIALFGLFINNSIELDDSIEDSFPNLKEFLMSIGLNVE